MKKSQLRKIIKESIKQLLNEQANLGWSNTNYPFLDYGVYITGCPCNKVIWSSAQVPTCPPNDIYSFGNNLINQPLIIPGNPATPTNTSPTNLNVGDVVGSTMAPYVILTVNSWGCNANDPNINGNPSNCPGGGGHSTVSLLPPSACPAGTSSTGCTDIDFDYTATPCGQTHLVPAPGGANSWTTWLNARANGYQNIGCQHIQNVINWITPQLPNASGIQYDRKLAKINWAGCMQTQCGC